MPDDEEIQRREEHSQRLRNAIGVGEASDGVEAPLGFLLGHAGPGPSPVGSSDSGRTLSPSRSLIRIMSQMMEEVGYLTELLSRDIEKNKRLMMTLQPSCNEEKDPNPRRNVDAFPKKQLTLYQRRKNLPARHPCPDQQEGGGVPGGTPCPGRMR